ncbi:hypothetical protein [Dickeya dianthicola]|nr:hypothetical protein [Dickeya dianthicola]ATO32251.1 hypothetical protein DDI_1083 [Dickeya dianthicola RNS04.9]
MHTREPARLGLALYKSVQIPASLLALPVSSERLPAQAGTRHRRQ